MSGKKALHLFQVDCFRIAKSPFNEERSYLYLYLHTWRALLSGEPGRLRQAQRTAWKRKAETPLLSPQQPMLDRVPRVPAAFVHVHSEEDSQATSQAAGLLL